MSEEQERQGFDAWAVVEIMGHHVIAGHVTEEAIGGASFLRVDVPSVDGMDGFTKYFGAQAIYAISPTTEAVVKEVVKQRRPKPINLWLPPSRYNLEDPILPFEGESEELQPDDEPF